MLSAYLDKLTAFPGYLLVPVGLFYMFAGFVVVRSFVTESLLDQAIAKITLKETDSTERARVAWLIAGGVVTYAAGSALALLSALAAWLFVLSLAHQVLHLAVLSPRYFDVDEPPKETDRRRTINAAILLGVVTIGVVAAERSGAFLSPFGDGRMSAIATLVLTAMLLVWIARRARLKD